MDDELAREAVIALNAALATALDAVAQSFVDGHGPRGVKLMPLLLLASEAADKRDAFWRRAGEGT